jgi:hypothetical protein
MAMRLKRATPVIEDDFGVCLWRMPDGALLGDEEGRFLSMSGKLDDPVVESKMKKSAVYWLGDEALLGEPIWLPGSRQISDGEADDQMENLLDGKAPDEVQSMKQRGLLDP